MHIFDCLNEDIIHLLIETLAESYGESRSIKSPSDAPNTKKCLGALRLSHPRFAYSESLHRHFFHTLRIKASPEHAAFLRICDLPRLGRFVKRVIFEPTHHSWAMDLDLFQEIVAMQTLYRIVPERDRTRFPQAELPFSRPTRLAVIQKYAPAGSFSEAEVMSAFNSYCVRANQIRALFMRGVFHMLWTTLLLSLPNVTTVRVGRAELDASEDEFVAHPPGYEIHPHPHDNSHGIYACEWLAGPVSDALLTTVVTCMTGVTIQRLEIECIFGLNIDWQRDPRWAALRFNGIEELTFSVQNRAEWTPPPVWRTPFSLTHAPVIGHFDYGARRSSVGALSVLLHKCQDTLVRFKMAFPIPRHPAWPLEPTIHLRQLQVLEIWVTLLLSDRGLAALLQRLDNLRHIIIHYFPYPASPGEARWRVVFDAIRNHPNRMRVQLHDLGLEHSIRVSLDHHTSRGVSYQPTYPVWKDVRPSLSNYLAGCGGWNEALKHCFG
ncbi:hypothetical protein N7474_003802 [Penicillium riverlandense]|uniref:uncharacterized protein n=1 Tax=Penicillium riverlandense TaxID=1903569 RepID=UPI0025489029|nr:uncharacterized protein N7474_003802 [Penicillium riverlandense]KAJ5818211.1 hypothetical protein N7474_003802 [Penicillium riverlandense]